MFAGQRPRPLSLKRPATLTKDPWPEPVSPSPTFSSLSSNELVVLLKSAHASLREKEKDLTLAAELGHYLLENNMTLKSQYDSLLYQQQQQQQLRLQEDADAGEEEDWGYYYGNDSNTTTKRLANSSSFQYNKAAHQIELASLQDKNMELQRLLEDAQQQADKLQAVHDKKARELEHDVTVLKDHLDLATQKIEEMEEDQHHRSVRQRRHHEEQHPRNMRHPSFSSYDQHLQQHDSLLADLRSKISQLEHENNQLVESRRSVQDRLNRALYDVEALQTQFNLGEWTREGCAQLNTAYQRQLDYIAQLNESLEEHRHILTSLVENGVLGDSNINMIISKSYRNEGHHNINININNNNNNLMAELGQAWHRDQLIKDSAVQIGAAKHHQQQQQQQQRHGPLSNHLNRDDEDDDGYSSLPLDGIKQHRHHRFGYLESTSSAHLSLYRTSSTSPASAHAYHLPTFSDNNGNQVYNHMMADDYDDYDDDTDDDDEDDELYGPLDSTDAITSYNLYPNLTGRYEYPTTITTGLMMAGLKGRHSHHEEEAAAGVVHKVQRWCRFAIVLTVAVFINAFEGPDTMLEDPFY